MFLVVREGVRVPFGKTARVTNLVHPDCLALANEKMRRVNEGEVSLRKAGRIFFKALKRSIMKKR
jgi:hypothetical protein